MKRLLALLFLPALAALASLAPVQDEPPRLRDETIGETVNVHRIGKLWFAGQFEPSDVGTLVQRGIRTVVTLRTEGEIDWDEQVALSQAGIRFVQLGFRQPDTLTDEIFDELRGVLRDSKGPLLLHCGSANRVGGAWIPYRVLDQGVALETAVKEAKEIGLRNPGYEARARTYVAARRNDEVSVKPGINDSFKNPELDVQSYIDRFETESREIFSSREAIVRAVDLKPGDRIADVGAGTGLFTTPFAKAVGADGWVWAVDISPRFLERILGLVKERQHENVGAVLCSDRKVGLAPASVDVVFVCDTYHHFEYPQSTLASILRALRPGGRMVVIDFERVPGKTREWLMDHVRAGKDVFRSEIENAGFEFVREVDVEGLVENYVLEFRKPATR